MLGYIISMALAILAISSESLADKGPDLGQALRPVVLAGDLGGRISGETWASSELQGKMHVLFYIDPDEATTNDEVSEALRAEKFPGERFGSVAIINMAATWKPNFAINSKLEQKQKDFPRTIYVRDMKKVLVKEWGAADDNNDVLLFDQKGALIFYHAGKLSPVRIKELIEMVKAKI